MRAFNPWVGAAASVAVMLLPFVHWWVPGIVTPSTAWAAIGSIVTVLGIITIGRPVIRVGYEKWLETSRVIDGGYVDDSEAPPEYREEERQKKLDAIAVQVIGPSLAIGGTLLNGFSGFF